MKASAIVVGAGAGRRFGGKMPKALVPLGGRPMILQSLEAFARVREVVEVIVVLPERHIASFLRVHGAALRRARVKRVVPGGAARFESVRRGLLFADTASDVVLIHDAARPFVTAGLIRKVAKEAYRVGAAVPVVPLSDTIKRVSPTGRIIGTEDRASLRGAQTPQGIRTSVVMELAARRVWEEPVTDDVQWVERLGRPVTAVEGDPANFKVTTRDDYRRAQEIAGRGR